MLLHRIGLALLLAVTILSTMGVAEAAPRYRGMNVVSGLSAQDVEDLATLNVNVVRYQLVWNGPVDTAGEAEYLAWLSGALDQLDGLIPVFEKHGIKIILDLHTPPGGFATRTTPAQHRVFAAAWAQRTLVTVWETIAARYKGNTSIVAYELMSEPNQGKVASGLKAWTPLYKEIVAKVHAIDPSRTFVIAPIYGNPDKLRSLKPAKGGKGKKFIYSFNIYYPESFSKQGLEGRAVGATYPTKRLNKKTLAKRLSKVVEFQRANRAQMYVGEFSVVRWAPSGAGAKFLKDYISVFESNRWHWTYHVFREADAWSVEHSSDQSNLARSSGITDRLNVLLSYFQKNKK
jgi:endoglucanase